MSDGGMVPAHGHGRLNPWPAGRSGNPGGRPRELAAALALARRSSSEMVEKLIDLARNSTDERVQAMSAIKLLELSGMAHLSSSPEGDPQPLDLSHLSPEERAALAAALGVVRRLTGRGGAEVAAEQAEADAVRERIADRIASLRGGGAADE